MIVSGDGDRSCGKAGSGGDESARERGEGEETAGRRGEASTEDTSEGGGLSEAESRERERAKQKRERFGRLASKKFTCGVCSVRARVNDEREGVKWYGCDRGEGCKVGGWFHMLCLPESEQESLRASLVSGDKWVCAFCMEE